MFDESGRTLRLRTISLQPGRLPGVDVPQSTYCSEGGANFDPPMKIKLMFFPQSRGGGEFWSLMKTKLMLLARSANWS